MSTVELSVKGMSCGSCVLHVTEAEGFVYRKEILAVVQRSAEQSRLRTRRIKYPGSVNKLK